MGICLDECCPLTWTYGWESAAEALLLSSFFWLLCADWNVLLILLRYLYPTTPAGIRSKSKKTAGHAGRPAAEHPDVLFPKTHLLVTFMICKEAVRTISIILCAERVLDSMTIINSFNGFQLNIFFFSNSVKVDKIGISNLQAKTKFKKEQSHYSINR